VLFRFFGFLEGSFVDKAGIPEMVGTAQDHDEEDVPAGMKPGRKAMTCAVGVTGLPGFYGEPAPQELVGASDRITAFEPGTPDDVTFLAADGLYDLVGKGFPGDHGYFPGCRDVGSHPDTSFSILLLSDKPLVQSAGSVEPGPAGSQRSCLPVHR
jgi:hypothetical protein